MSAPSVSRWPVACDKRLASRRRDALADIVAKKYRKVCASSDSAGSEQIQGDRGGWRFSDPPGYPQQMGRRVVGRWVSAVNMVALVAMLAASLVTSATAQVLPSDPIQLAAGRLVLGGELSASVSSSHDTGYFNRTDYEHDVLRLLRLGLSAALAVSERVTVLGEVRTENGTPGGRTHSTCGFGPG